jgi:hypothetical protein
MFLSRSPPALPWSSLFFLSGVSGLVYQVIWVRQLARVFGKHRALGLARHRVFMGGLGAGSYLVGRFSDRRHRADPSRARSRLYGWAELVHRRAGPASSRWVLPRLSALSAAISSYERGELRLVRALHLGPPAPLRRSRCSRLGPATFLMGGTLTLADPCPRRRRS